MPRRWLVVLGCLSLAGCHSTRPPVAPSSAILPLAAVRLYENGVGYFERQGMLSPGGASTLGVPASHVDDALKTLLVLSRGHARVSGIEFPSVVSDGAARALAGLPSEGDTPADYEHVLRSLVGFRVEITRATEPLRGRLLDVEREPAGARGGKPADDASAASAAKIAAYSLLVVGDGGEIERLSTAEVRAIRPLDRAFSARLDTAADALGGRSAQLRRELSVRASASASVRIGYIAETPVWRASYRLVLPHDGPAAMLQGWALVHNDTDEAWKDVDVELVNGAPDSFLFPMAAPRYARRSLSTPEVELSTVPQLALKTADGLWGDHVDGETTESFGAGGLGEGGGGYGEGIGLGGVGTIGHGAGFASEGVSTGVSIGDLSSIAGAKGKDEGRLFSYHLAEKVSLAAHGSSLLPLLERAVRAHRFTRFEDGGQGRAAVRLSNDSPYILPAGPIAVFEASGFSGEALVDRLRPEQRAFLEYGVDLDASLSIARKDVESKAVRVSFDPAKGFLKRDEIRVSEHRLGIDNQAALPRSVGYVLSGVVTNAKVEGADELDYDAKAGEAIAFVSAPPRTRLERVLRVTEARQVTTSLDKLSRTTVEALAEAESLPAGERAVLRAALPHVVALADAERTLSDIERRLHEVDEDLQRNREHLKAATGGEGAVNPIAGRIVALERSRDEARRSSSALGLKITALKQAAAHALEALPRDAPQGA
jgi:hypothetical protein